MEGPLQQGLPPCGGTRADAAPRFAQAPLCLRSGSRKAVLLHTPLLHRVCHFGHSTKPFGSLLPRRGPALQGRDGAVLVTEPPEGGKLSASPFLPLSRQPAEQVPEESGGARPATGRLPLGRRNSRASGPSRRAAISRRRPASPSGL